ncbi:MAG: GNAT family N-acetyltransferase [Gammaproteobacteria bacterium]|nr:GNAT family N-acetyltransferase [Gammaproteobacteria bacterium]MCF6261631.1 GNAT family N-acetyltransferase [Gammaproteobacteria bacterium]
MGLLKQKNVQQELPGFVVLNSKRLMLAPVSRAFAEDIFKEFTADITRYMRPKPAGSIDETCMFIDASREKMSTGDQLVMAILDADTVQFSGVCAIHGKEQGIAAELGIWLKKSAQGKNLGREAIALLVQWAKYNLALSHLVYSVDKNNIPSRKIAESLGGIVVSEGQQKSQSGKHLNELVYQIDIPVEFEI